MTKFISLLFVLTPTARAQGQQKNYRHSVTFVAPVLLVGSDEAELVSAATMGPFTHYLRAVVLLHLLNNFWWQSTCSHFICALGFVIGSRLFHCRSTIYSSPWCLGAKTSTAPELPTMCGVHFLLPLGRENDP